ncbi:MAG: hypothetical protein CSA07_04500 [Bacteroidia bacterium]|nr:MAG: hypothetical protein CSA07_04500 [Bacteroidia bacterium]
MAKKKRSWFSTAYSVLFLILVLAAGLTYVVPSGEFERLTYSAEGQEFIISGRGETRAIPATQRALDSLQIKLELAKFTEGTIYKPVAIPGSYAQIAQQPQGFFSVIKSPVQGIADSVGIVIFVLILGGIMGILAKMNAFDAGMVSLSRSTKGKEFLLVTFVFLLVTLGGTTFGMAEETIAFYPILMPIFLVSGFDALVCIAAIYMGSTIGTMFSTTSPFSVVIASEAAGISFTTGLAFRIVALVLASVITLLYIYRYVRKIRRDKTASLVYEDEAEIHAKFLSGYDPNEAVPYTWRIRLSLLLFAAAFPVMIWGVASAGWWFEEMSALFLGVSLILMAISGLSEKENIGAFVAGAGDLIGVALTIGLARSINMVMDGGQISDTLLYYSTEAVSGMGQSLFAVVQLILFSFLGFFIPSASGLAMLSMPIMAPLADTVGLSREVVINAYNWGQGWMSFITPTGLILVSLEMVGVPFSKWLKFILPLMAIIGIFAALMLIINTMIV